MKTYNNEIVYKEKGGVAYIQFKKLLQYENIEHAYVLKPLDFRTHFENDAKVSYARLFQVLGIDKDTLVKPYQAHTNNVKVVKKAIKEKETELVELGEIDRKMLSEKEKVKDINVNIDRYVSETPKNLENTDGLITSQKYISLATTNADCIIMLFYDPINRVIGNVHSGWRGTFKKICQNAILKMKEECGSNPKDIIVCICPSIRVCHFEVDEDVKQECEEIFRYTGRIEEIIKKGEIKEGKQKYFIDTVLINKIVLEENGVNTQNIADCGICSCCNSDIVHSRRSDGVNYGLGTAIIMEK